MRGLDRHRRDSWPRRRAGLPSLLSVAVMLASCARPKAEIGASAPEGVLRVASQKGGTKSQLLASGVLDHLPYRIEWSEFPAAQHLLEALGAGAVDLGAVGDAPFQFAYQAGSPIKAVQVLRYDRQTSSSAILVPATSSVRSLAELRGLRIATGRGSAGHYLLLRALDKAHLSVSDVQIVFLAPGDAKAAFSSGAVGAWSTWNPYVGAAVLHDGARILPDSIGLSTGVGFIAANEQAIAKKRPLIEDFLRRNARAQEWVRLNAGSFAEVLAKETGLPLDVARYTAERGARGAAALDATLIAEQRAVLAEFKVAGALPATRTFAGGFDTTLFAAESSRN
jgi:sulfonate transport system substrate-binding protein